MVETLNSMFGREVFQAVVQRAGAGVAGRIVGVGAAVRADDLGRIDEPPLDQFGQRAGRTAEFHAIEERGVVEHHQVVVALQPPLLGNLRRRPHQPADHRLGHEEVAVVGRRGGGQDRGDVAVIEAVVQGRRGAMAASTARRTARCEFE